MTKQRFATGPRVNPRRVPPRGNRRPGRALAGAGGSLDDVVKTTTFVTDQKHVPALREIRAKYLNRNRPPANTLVVVSSLARPDLLIEIEAVAVLGAVVRHTGPER